MERKNGKRSPKLRRISWCRTAWKHRKKSDRASSALGPHFSNLPSTFFDKTLTPLIFCEKPFRPTEKTPRHLIAFENLLSLVCQTYYRQASEFEMLTVPTSETDRRAQTYNNLIMIQKASNQPLRKRGRPCRTKVFVATKSSKLPASETNSNSVSPTHMLDYLASPLKSDMEYGFLTRKLDPQRNCYFRNRPLPLRKKI